MQALRFGGDNSFSGPIERILIATNGPEQGGCANPQRQGLSADLADGYRPNDVLGEIPTLALDYSPTWDAQLYQWTQDAINNRYRGQSREEFQVLTFVQQDGLITARGGAPFTTGGSPSIVPSYKGSIDRVEGKAGIPGVGFPLSIAIAAGANEWCDKLVIGSKFASDDRNFRLCANEQPS
jgi:hypothetical protein